MKIAVFFRGNEEKMQQAFEHLTRKQVQEK